MVISLVGAKSVSAHPNDQLVITIVPLSVEEVYKQADDAANGAIVLMSGMVRNNSEGFSVLHLEYQAYEPMAIAVFKQIAAEIRQTWTDVTHVVIHHRVGRLEIGEISVLIAVGCPHRKEAFEACQYAIDTLKHRAPIWKKEFYYGKTGEVCSSWVKCC
ncbi:molybdenum cofactor biosynthesis protein MoaE [Leptolyngbya sp. FACHB-17]|uniref:molybdenum cofactor biosynthesis protein MoaE n=1 Tax=unclassified Leptolyngbya TaxID=2650499 RepID=UPI00168014C8|nr:molybdenum cofactor biosynthesis protein MoaE [Leptolyngbya sp. FACHB-17]MBD2081202.1 molybdenum cofactor biosynthesis protein MoaE [Leptolyngbya sp. FACHB-17]